MGVIIIDRIVIDEGSGGVGLDRGQVKEDLHEVGQFFFEENACLTIGTSKKAT